ncbi:hypothetical protein E3N88_22894 [Mikania micrantha]|uniref:Protein kinase domain-containing protein n=1 Tax=Mikania micrantha TaxID=192012 RepID=A0A5N6ND62_9ASTR|nr:hypothetical protein E3N88_41618 [Mikania micrantha]KAD4585293.1 hypothetical protein E3N88_22894 [Mikania micrantha]
MEQSHRGLSETKTTNEDKELLKTERTADVENCLRHKKQKTNCFEVGVDENAIQVHEGTKEVHGKSDPNEDEDFILLAEVNFLGRLAHPNIIRLLGYCKDDPFHSLVYKYMPNKSFDRFLFSGHLSTKCDIYALGMVLLETITGQKAMDLLQRVGQKNLPKWAARIGSNKRNRKKKMDPRLKGMYPQKSASKCSALASRCIANNPKHRPSGEQVLQSLEQIYALD